MNVSIRKFLLINLLLAIAITTTITVLGNYYIDQKDIQDHLDTLLSTSALSYQILLDDKTSSVHYQQLQQSLKTLEKRLDHVRALGHLNEGQLQHIQEHTFQVVDKDGHRLLGAGSAEFSLPTQLPEGFSDQYLNQEYWRVFTVRNPHTDVTVSVAERYNTRYLLVRMIARDDIYIMFLTFPLSGLLIWYIIGRGLNSLSRVTKEVSDRAPNYLEAVPEENVPIEIKPLIDELNQLFSRLRQAFDREKRFASDAAHELRTPLAALKTQAQVALGASDDEERQAVLRKLIEGVNRASHVVQQLLTMSRLVPEATFVEENTKVNLEKVAQDVMSQLVPSAMEKNIDIELICRNDFRRVLGNATAISILMRNLIDNAIRYTPEHGRVSVIIEGSPNQVDFTVRDTGPGIPNELSSRVFERFYRVLGSKAPGSGLGLAIVHQIVLLHHAKIALHKPASGTGLEVTVTFPALV